MKLIAEQLADVVAAAVQAAVKSHGTRKISAWFAQQDAALTGRTQAN